MKFRSSVFSLLLGSLSCSVCAVEPTVDEMSDARRWAAAKFEAQAQVAPGEAKLEIEREGDNIVFGRSGHKMQQQLMWEYSPLKVGDTVYTNGIYCHSNCKIKVTLPGPGRVFEAKVGVDSNDRTKRGLGTVVFAVHVNGAERWRSDVLKGGMAARPLKVDLGGASEFVLEVSDAGDGVPYDYADWVDAMVTLSAGQKVWLGGSPRGAVDTDPPFSFDYDGKSSRAFLKDWEVQRSRRIDETGTFRTIRYRDPATGLEARLETIEYRDFPTVDWTIHFKNTSSEDTPIISNIRAVDTRLERGKVGEFVLHHQNGSTAAVDELRPFETKLGPNANKRIATYGGRPSNVWPYFNVEWHGAGAIIVMGWSGQWAINYMRDGAQGLQVRGGQEMTHFKLLPGEDVRGPRIVMQFWRGDVVRSQNIWRRWMRAHNMPKPGGKLPPTQLAGTSGMQFADMRFANEANQMEFIDRYVEENIKIDYWWMDYAWFYHKVPDARYEADLDRFPRGLRSITDHARSKGIKGLVWFEPEHTGPGWRVHDKHPEWCLGTGDHKLINLGHPDALAWLTDDIDATIRKEGIDLYRQDFNMEPLEAWRMTDAADRQGITEIKYIEGYLKFWDELLRRHPNMVIDSCSSGGKRNDLETMRRGVPLWRSDYNNVAYTVFNYRIAPNQELPTGIQCQTYGLARWLPYFGTAARDDDEYIFRSGICPAIVSAWDVRRKDLDYDLLRRLTQEWKQVARYMRDGDYYPLTVHSMANDVWMAWQFHDVESGEGVVQAFRREDSPMTSGLFELGGLSPNSQYTITHLGDSVKNVQPGRKLIQKGLGISIPEAPGSALIVYKELR